MSGSEPEEARGRALLGPRLFAIGVLLLGALLFTESLGIGQTRGYSPVGPSTFPLVVSLGLVMLGLASIVRLSWRPDPDYARDVHAEESATHWRTVALLGAALLAYALSLGPLGYVIPTGAFFAFVAWVLGSRRVLRDLLIGTAGALVIWFAFTQFLGVRLPTGLLDPILPGG